jgi:ActR/RegA family two-component response regulator
MLSVTPEAEEAPAGSVTPWVLLVVDDEGQRRVVRRQWESAGFAVEAVATAQDALDCMRVMTPALVVIEDRLYRPAQR